MPKSRRGSFSPSPLARPETPIHRLASGFQNHYHFPDPSPLYITAAALIANMSRSSTPVWLMLIGPPSCGGTALLSSFSAVARVLIRSSLSGAAALLSGVKRKDIAPGAKGGLLRELGDRGVLIFKDFTTFLGQAKQSTELVDAFREIYDGQWTRDIGSDGGRSISWEGRIGVFAKCTESIDAHHKTMAEMGERFVFFRWPESDGWHEAMKSIANGYGHNAALTNGSGVMGTTDLIECFMAETDCTWDGFELPPLDIASAQRITAITQFAVRCRGPVERDPYTREIVSINSVEGTPRLGQELAQLYSAMVYIGVDSAEAWAITARLAMDCMPRNRLRALRSVMTAGVGGCGSVDVASFMGLSQTTAIRTCEELECYKILERNREGKWRTTEIAREFLRLGWI